MIKVAALLTVHNRKKKTLDCLDSLFNCLLPENHQLDVFLVDDGCTDSTANAVKEKFSQVNIIQGDGNLYWNRGMHLAWETAAKTKDYDYYLWLNDDTLLFSNALEELLKCSEILHNKSIVCGTTCSINNKNKITYGGQLLKQGLIIPDGKIQKCDYFNGNIVLVSQYVYNQVGTNDPIFHHALGDFDYGLRAGKLGIQSLVVPAILGVCETHADLPKWSNSDLAFSERWNSFFSPLGVSPFEFFKYRKRHFGLFQATLTFVSNFAHLFFPQMWKQQ